MSKASIISRVTVICMLVALVSAVGSKTALAAETPFASPALSVCKEVPSSLYKGLYSEGHCRTNEANGAFAWATPGNSGQATWDCLLAPTANQLYTEALCQTDSATGGFLAVLFPEPFPKILGEGGSSTFKGKIAGVSAEITCSTNTLVGEPETARLTGKVTIAYNGCKVAKPEKCEVDSENQPSGTIITLALMGTLTSAKLITLKPEATLFAAVEYKGSECTIAGTTAKIEGTQMCTFAAGVEEAAEQHEMACGKTESELTFGGNSATYEGSDKVMQECGDLWRIH